MYRTLVCFTGYSMEMEQFLFSVIMQIHILKMKSHAYFKILLFYF